jgi:hypothetical protein
MQGRVMGNELMHVAYYRGLNLSKLLYQHTYLMLALELLFHDDRYGAKYLRYYQLHKELNETFIALGKGELSNSAFDHYIKCCKEKKLIAHTHYKRESRFSATDKAISYIEEMKIKKPEYANMKVVDMPEDATKNIPKKLVESIQISDLVACTKNPIADNKLSKRGPETIVRKMHQPSQV